MKRLVLGGALVLALGAGGYAQGSQKATQPAKPGPDARSLDPAQLDYEITRLLLELEDDTLRERSDYNEAAQSEAERAGDREAIGRLLLERRQINEMRLSLDRRRDQTRLLASHRR